VPAASSGMMVIDRVGKVSACAGEGNANVAKAVTRASASEARFSMLDMKTPGDRQNMTVLG